LFHAQDAIRAFHVTGVQTCALPICGTFLLGPAPAAVAHDQPVACACLTHQPFLVDAETVMELVGERQRSRYAVRHRRGIGGCARSEERRVGTGWETRSWATQAA